MNVISYFNLIPDFKFSSDSQQLIDVWKKSWQEHGWNTILLDESYARNNPLFDKSDLNNPDANFYKTIPSSRWQYHRSCYCRLLAYCQYVRENGDTLYSDYDVINYGFEPKILSSTEPNSLFCGTRCVVFLGQDGIRDIERVIYNFSKNTFQETLNLGSSNDMRIMKKYTTVFSLKLDENGKRYSSNILPDFSNQTPLVHYDGGCYKRGVNKNMSRLEIIKKYENDLPQA